MTKLATDPRRNGPTRALREIGRIGRMPTALDWIGEPDLHCKTTEESDKNT